MRVGFYGVAFAPYFSAVSYREWLVLEVEKAGPMSGAMSKGVGRKIRRMALVLGACLATRAFGDGYVDPPDALRRIVEAAEGPGSSLLSGKSGEISYALWSAEFLGAGEAPFGTVYVARLFYIRSGPKGTRLPGRGHTFIVFLDGKFKVRNYWEVDFALGRLSVDGSKLSLDGKEILDWDHPPAGGRLVVDGGVQEVPEWR